MDSTVERLLVMLRNGAASLALVEQVSRALDLDAVPQEDLSTLPTWMASVGDQLQPGQVILTRAKPNPQATSPNGVGDPMAMLLRIATVLEFLHSTTDDKPVALVHGNLNSSCISVHGGSLVLSGFGHCGIDPVPAQPENVQRDPYAPGGHLPSMAPELVTKEMRTTQTDVYAFGMLIFRLYAGKDPFDEVCPRDQRRVSEMARLGGGKRPGRAEIRHPGFTDELWVLMTECWAQQPSARPTIADVRARLACMVEERASEAHGVHVRFASI